MKVKCLLPAIALLAVLPARAEYLFSTKFNSGRIPAIMTTEDRDGEPLSTADYRNGYTDKGWTVALVSGGQYAAMSPSHSRTDKPQSNLLSTPAFTVSGTRPMIRWKGRSIHPDFPESYLVLVQETGKDTPDVVYECLGEGEELDLNDVWTLHAVSIESYIGKEIKVSFECISTNKYLLAIDDLYIGDPEEQMYQCEVSTPVFVGTEWDGSDASGEQGLLFRGVLWNMGMPLEGGRVAFMSEGEEIASMPVEGVLRCGESCDFSMRVPLERDRTIPYTIDVVDADGNHTTVTENILGCSYFPRTLLVEEYTGLWCVNCPSGMLQVERMERRFGEQAITVSGHINDLLECAEYRAGITAYSVPWMVLNRNNGTAGDDTSKFEEEYRRSTPAFIEISDYETGDDGMLRATAQVTWAYDLDNSSDRYRLGYMLTHDVVKEDDNEYRQKNGLGTVASERFYYLPSSIKSDLSPNHNVVVSAEDAFSGRPYSLPSSFTGMETAQAQISIVKPEAVDDLADTRLVAYIIDTADGTIVNACAQKLDEAVTSIPVTVAPETDAQEEYYTLQGMRVASPDKGIYIVRKGGKVSKVIF